RVMWARVKGRTENRLLAMPLNAYMFRAGYVQPMKGVRSKTGLYQAFYTLTRPLYPLLRRIAPDQITPSDAVGRAMIEVAANGYRERILRPADINALARLRGDPLTLPPAARPAAGPVRPSLPSAQPTGPRRARSTSPPRSSRPAAGARPRPGRRRRSRRRPAPRADPASASPARTARPPPATPPSSAPPARPAARSAAPPDPRSTPGTRGTPRAARSTRPAPRPPPA